MKHGHRHSHTKGEGREGSQKPSESESESESEAETTDLQPKTLGPQTQKPQSPGMMGAPTVISKRPSRKRYETTRHSRHHSEPMTQSVGMAGANCEPNVIDLHHYLCWEHKLRNGQGDLPGSVTMCPTAPLAAAPRMGDQNPASAQRMQILALETEPGMTRNPQHPVRNLWSPTIG